ncbi:PREDICTED: uncharacterized protein LOC105462444 [Wasmannia auropunctata]|uniref:uncharacterized protein LOC105462444 n=1 Tax=Wasmannia auropunctata TaxID=64793 RepID=UPI0005EFBF3F|nr:PREDICTED: uncharacterized protein LOC105462444 [Wasmannia auropunctata]
MKCFVILVIFAFAQYQGTTGLPCEKHNVLHRVTLNPRDAYTEVIGEINKYEKSNLPLYRVLSQVIEDTSLYTAHEPKVTASLFKLIQNNFKKMIDKIESIITKYGFKKDPSISETIAPVVETQTENIASTVKTQVPTINVTPTASTVGTSTVPQHSTTSEKEHSE